MTVIAFDGKTLAADKRATYGNGSFTVTKIFRRDDMLIGIAGCGETGMEVMAWLERGADPATFPESARDKDDAPRIIVIKHGKVLEYGRTPYPLEYEDQFIAIGCGRDFAISAMHCGKSAREAVEITCLYDTGCGNGIDTLTLDA